MNISLFQSVVQWLGGALAYTALGIVLYGVWRGTQQKTGRTVGLAGSWLRSWWFYLASSALFFGIAYLGWTSLPWTVSPSARVWMLVFGSLLYFPGLLVLVWARLVLGKNYFVSTGFGAQLFEGHQLITSGPYGAIRHPIYSAFILILGSTLFISSNWLIGLCWAGMTILETVSRIGFEESLMIEYFGDRYREYMKKTGRLFPKLSQ